GAAVMCKTAFEHAASFNRSRSFQMGEGKVIEKGALTENTIVKDRVDTAVQNGLMTKGLVTASGQRERPRRSDRPLRGRRPHRQGAGGCGLSGGGGDVGRLSERLLGHRTSRGNAGD